MTPHQQRFKESNMRCRRRWVKADWLSYGRCMSRSLTAKKAAAEARPAPPPGVCFRRKADAITRFANRNRDVIDAFGGMLKPGSKGEFDAINEKYSLRGKRRVVNIQQAIARVLPTKAPYCLDQLDLDAINETAPARHAGAFVLPQEAEEAIANRRYVQEYEQHYRDQFEGVSKRMHRRRRRR